MRTKNINVSCRAGTREVHNKLEKNRYVDLGLLFPVYYYKGTRTGYSNHRSFWFSQRIDSFKIVRVGSRKVGGLSHKLSVAFAIMVPFLFLGVKAFAQCVMAATKSAVISITVMLTQASVKTCIIS